MAISIDWGTRIIYVPKSDLTLVQNNPSEIRSMDLNWFRIQLKNLEDSEVGIAYPDTHRHNSEVLLGGLTYARVIEIINDFTITFEDGQYAVNLTGANSNVGDKVNVNQVSVRSSNSAGMVVVSGAGGGIDESTIHAALNSYVNKNLYKADISGLATSAQITTLSAEVANLDSDISAVQADISAVDTKLNVIDTVVDTIALDVTDIEGKIDSLSTSLANLDSDVALADAKIVSIGVDVDTIDTRTVSINSKIDAIDIPTVSENANAVWSHSSATQLLLNVSFIKDIEGGKWEITNNQMIFYKEDNVTEIARFNLYNENGVLSNTNIFSRIKI